MASGRKFLNSVTSRVLWIGTIVVSMVGAAKASGVAPKEFDAEAWLDVRKEFEQSRERETLSEPLRRVIGRLETGADLRDVVVLSYSVARTADLPALDNFWSLHIASRRDNGAYMTWLRVRAQVLGTVDLDRNTYLENWLYFAQAGNYDCGGGDGNCGVGNGNGGGDGTTNEGGGGSEPPDGDGDSGGGNDDRPGNKLP